MKCFPIIIAAGLNLALSSVASAEIPALVQQWLTKQAGMSDVTVNFLQRKSGGVLKKEVSTPGQLWKGKAGAFRWHLGKPARTVLVFNGSELYSYESRKKKWKEVDLDDRKYSTLLGFLGARKMNASELEKDFTIEELSKEASLVSYALVPRSGFARGKLNQIDLQIDPRNQLLKQLRILMTDGAQTIISMSVPTKKKLPLQAFEPGPYSPN